MPDRQDEGIGQKYAVLINGDGWDRYVENLSLAYRVLSQSGYRKENIHIFDYRGRQNNTYPVQGPAILEEIKNQFTKLGRIIEPCDHLFVYTTDHGDRGYVHSESGERIEVSTLRLLVGRVNEIEFEELVKDIRPKLGIFLFDQCHSGGFAERLSGKDRITISACSANQSSRDRSFPEAFFGAFLRNSSDADNNGKVSINNAYRYALRHDPQTRRGWQRPSMFYQVDGEAYL
jgi:hypothetical protein